MSTNRTPFFRRISLSATVVVTAIIGMLLGIGAILPTLQSPPAIMVPPNTSLLLAGAMSFMVTAVLHLVQAIRTLSLRRPLMNAFSCVLIAAAYLVVACTAQR